MSHPITCPLYQIANADNSAFYLHSVETGQLWQFLLLFAFLFTSILLSLLIVIILLLIFCCISLLLFIMATRCFVLFVISIIWPFTTVDAFFFPISYQIFSFLLILLHFFNFLSHMPALFEYFIRNGYEKNKGPSYPVIWYKYI